VRRKLAPFPAAFSRLRFPAALRLDSQAPAHHPFAPRAPVTSRAPRHRIIYVPHRYDDGDEEDVFCLTFATQSEFLGVVTTHALVDGGDAVDVTAENKSEYARRLVHWTLRGAVAKQFESFAQGFWSVVRRDIASLLSAADLERAVVGERALDFAALERGTKYVGGWNASNSAVRRFWRVVLRAFDDAEREALLAFATGSRRAPIGGLGHLQPPFVVQRAGPHSAMLPTSHTCFNTLLLPEYADDATMENRLRLAITQCEGFGLQ